MSGVEGELETPFADHDPGWGPEAFPRLPGALAKAEEKCNCGEGGSRFFRATKAFETNEAPGRVKVELTGC